MIFDLEKNTAIEKKYWELREEKKSNDSDYLNKIFLNAIELQQQSDTKVGIEFKFRN